ncbi:hypothetical protein RM545_15515 [Zunongwangia sp. F260]|uniref:Lectin n=1 Tax=Autumnicola lenta TaxID=3075593 RepID=A0ABU3CPD5_9FLAO|nr:hypothetical protein [Zunongwangia sp. F260]MDT0648102.1 hypothetical protein [Zunongwangia sp. F260]
MRVLKMNILFCGFMCLFLVNVHAQKIPDNYKLLYEEDFEGDFTLSSFEFTDAEAWKIGNVDKNHALELHKKSAYSPPVRSPLNIAFIKDRKFGSFILEAKLQQTGKEYGHRDLCLFFGLKDPSNFYYTHIASNADPNAHNIFLVNDAPRTNIANKTTVGFDWGTTEEWHKIRLERDISSGIIRVFVDDMNAPVMEAEDKHFDFGYIGFGSFDDTGKIDNVKIWGPALAPVKHGFF